MKIIQKEIVFDIEHFFECSDYFHKNSGLIPNCYGIGDPFAIRLKSPSTELKQTLKDCLKLCGVWGKPASMIIKAFSPIMTGLECSPTKRGIVIKYDAFEFD